MRASVPSAGASPPWLGFNFCFFETKIKEKVFCATVNILKAKIFSIYINRKFPFSQSIYQNLLAKAKHNSFSSIFNGLPLKIEEKECSSAADAMKAQSLSEKRGLRRPWSATYKSFALWVARPRARHFVYATCKRM